MKIAISLSMLLLAIPFPTTANGLEKPNVIVILADDLGFNDLGFQATHMRSNTMGNKSNSMDF